MTWEQEVQLSYHRGVAEGVEKGREEGLSEGVKKGHKETAIKMLEDGFLPVERISEYTQLSLEEIRALQTSKASLNP